MLWYCRLVHDGVVKKEFFREGKSAEEVKEQIEVFQWPKGHWIIIPAEEMEVYFNEEDN